MFKNVVFYRVGPGFSITTEMLRQQPARPCGPSEMQTLGFTAPHSSAPDVLAYAVGKSTMVCLEIDERLLPSAVIKEAVAERVKEIEKDEGRRVGRKEKRELSESITLELLPKSFTRKKHIRAVFSGDFLLVEARTQPAAETMLEALRKVCEGAPFDMHRVINSPASAMTQWLAGSTPANLTVDNFCELISTSEESPSITYKNISLDADDIRERISCGYMPKRLAITINDRVSMIVTDQFTIKRLALLDIVTDNAYDAAEDDDERFNIDLTIYVGELLCVIGDLTRAFGGVYEDLADQGNKPDEKTQGNGHSAPLSGTSGADDLLSEKAVAIVKEHNRPSISLVQRHLLIGYNRAARLIEKMEQDGIVSAMDIKGARTVLAAE